MSGPDARPHVAAAEPPNVNTLWAGLLLDELWRGGVRHVCISPGSRSAPLAVAAARHEDLRVSVHLDERSAAFFALGIVNATGEPAALVCTSGTAAANYFPAVVEASLSRRPLIVLTADRPPELRHAGAPQTIDQTRLYGTFTRFFFDLPVPEASASALRALVSTVDLALAAARGRRSGPVHLNVPFRDPLAPVAGPPLPAETRAFLAARDSGTRPQRIDAHAAEPDAGAVEELAALVAAAPQGLIVCGPDAADRRVAGAVASLARRSGYPVIADVASGVRFAGGEFVCGAHDLFLRSPVFERVAPALTIELGGVPTSKPLQKFLDRDGIERVRVQDHPDRIDPAHRVRRCFVTEPAALLEAVAARVPARSGGGWGALFASAERVARGAWDAARARGEAPPEAETVARALAAVPEGSLVFLSSSMPIRDADAFAPVRADGLRVLANRGANGIDGVISSAAGAAAGSGRAVLLVTGDLAFLHDMNGLAAARSLPAPLVVLALNNDGGGIFSFLPIAEHADVFETYFGTPHGITFEAAAALHGLAYAKAPSAPAAEEEVRKAFARRISSVIEVPTDRAANARSHRSIWSRIAEIVAAEVSWTP